jgi:hypothetical protein
MNLSLVTQQDLERWLPWVLKNNESRYKLYTQEQTMDINELLEKIPPKGIFLIEFKKEPCLQI